MSVPTSLLFTLGLLWIRSSGAFAPTTEMRTRGRSIPSLYASDRPFPWETAEDLSSEETLLKIHLSLKDINVNPDMALAKVQQYTQSFPFAAVLPVQPLQYLPTHDGGVDVLFLRKKTEEKSSIDGGMRFFVTPNEADGGVEVEVKRNSKGQSISKMFTERIVVQAFCKGIAGEDEDRTGLAPLDFVSVSSVFHKWL